MSNNFMTLLYIVGCQGHVRLWNGVGEVDGVSGVDPSTIH